MKGFENVSEWDEAKIIENLKIRKTLPPFKYGLHPSEDTDEGVEKIKKEMILCSDGLLYQGEWDALTSKRHGRLSLIHI